MRTRMLGIAVVLSCLGSQANASTVLYAKFYTGGTGYGGAYNQTGTVYDKTTGLTTLSPTGGTPSNGDVIGTPLTFNSGGTTITATAPNLPNGSPNSVWDDLSPNFGGLGTGLLGQNSNLDQIAVPEALTLQFSSQVKLDGVSTLFATSHTTFGTNFTTQQSVINASSTIKFLLSVDGGAFTEHKLLDANTFLLGLLGTTFTFEEDTTKDANGNYINPELYVSALAYEKAGGGGGQGTTPLPAAFPLFATGLGVMGFLARRRKRKDAAAIAA